MDELKLRARDLELRLGSVLAERNQLKDRVAELEALVCELGAVLAVVQASPPLKLPSHEAWARATESADVHGAASGDHPA